MELYTWSVGCEACLWVLAIGVSVRDGSRGECEKWLALSMLTVLALSLGSSQCNLTQVFWGPVKVDACS